jgi:hypothetical protein
MRHVLLALFFAVVIGGTVHAADTNDFVTLDPEPDGYAWWLRARFHPFETSVRGIPVQDIRKTWCKASEFRRDLFPKDLDFDDGLSFSIDGYFDRSKTRQTALVGAYETCDGATGSFLMIVSWEPQGPAVRFVEETRTVHQFQILRAGLRSSIMTWNCMECDAASQLGWDRSKHRFVWVPVKPED